MKTTKLPSVEDRVKTICSCRKGSMDDKQYEATVEYKLTQDRNQAYTSLVEGIKAMERAVSGQIDTPGYDKDDQYNQDLRHILENVVKPLYGKE